MQDYITTLSTFDCLLQIGLNRVTKALHAISA